MWNIWNENMIIINPLKSVGFVDGLSDEYVWAAVVFAEED